MIFDIKQILILSPTDKSKYISCNFYQFSITIENQNRSDIIIEMFVTSPSWSIPGKYPSSKKLVTPSPCGYHPEKFNNAHSPSWKIGTDTRNKQNNNLSPGPGQYESNKSTSINKFGKFNREINRKNETNLNPGPDNYNPNYKCNRPSTPSCTISSKPKYSKGSQVPGPGHYQTTYCGKKSQICVKIGEQKRFLTKKLQGPGPQTYNPMKQTFKKVSIGFTKDDKKSCSYYQNQQIKVPGPGSYQSKDYFAASLKQNRGYSISSKYNPTQATDNPGPGQYDPKYISQPQSPKVSMKGKHENDKIQDIPGPGQYVFYKGFKGDRQGYSIGKGKRTYTNSSKYNPGPGTYNPRSVFHESPKFSLYGSRFQQPKSSSPGPGSYNADKNVLKRRPQSAKIGNSKRCQMEKSANPGPGEYQAKPRPSTPCNSFTKQSRSKMPTQLTPGPGHYEINQIFGQTQSYFKKT